jgi:hypothetical protein
MDALREELERTRAHLAEYVGHEPTIREEMHHLSDENSRLRQIAAYLLLEYAEKSTVDLWDDDIDGYTDHLDIEPSPDQRDSTRLTYTRGPARVPKRPKKPIDHRAVAELHANLATHIKPERQHHPIDPVASDFHLRMATLHATLANNEAGTASNADMRDALTLLRRREHAMRDAVSAHIADALTSTNRDRWSAARSLAQTLDAADANIDNAIDEHLADGGHDPKAAWNGPHEPDENDRDPWAADPKIQPLAVVADRVAQMFLNSKNPEVNSWARGMAQALERAGFDINDDIASRLRMHTLGDEPPF